MSHAEWRSVAHHDRGAFQGPWPLSPARRGTTTPPYPIYWPRALLTNNTGGAGIVDYLLHHCEPVQELKDAIADMTVADVARTLYGTARAALARMWAFWSRPLRPPHLHSALILGGPPAGLRSSQDFNEYSTSRTPPPPAARSPDTDRVRRQSGSPCAP